MRRFFIFALFLSALAAMAAPRVGHVFIISIDGGKPAVIQQSDMPVLNKLIAEGAHTWIATTIYPSITLPSHTSMLTGVEPVKHKILWNDWEPDRGIVEVPTVFSVAKQAGFSTAMFVGKEKFRTLIISNSVDKFDYNETESSDVTKTMAGETKPDKEGVVLADVVARDAAKYITAKKPGLCFIHFSDPDAIGHVFGWGSPAQIKSFAAVDTALGVVLKSIRDAGIADDSVLIITADHGGHGRTHGFNIPDDMQIPWIAWGKGVKKDFEITDPVNTCDTAATALWLLNAPCSEPIDGKPVASAFK